LADRAGVPRPSIVRWERGAVEPGFDMNPPHPARLRLRRLASSARTGRSRRSRLGGKLELTPQERVLAMLGDPAKRS